MYITHPTRLHPKSAPLTDCVSSFVDLETTVPFNSLNTEERAVGGYQGRRASEKYGVKHGSERSSSVSVGYQEGLLGFQ